MSLLRRALFFVVLVSLAAGGARLAGAEPKAAASVPLLTPLEATTTPLYISGRVGSRSLPLLESGGWFGIPGVVVEGWQWSSADATWSISATTTADVRGNWTLTLYDTAPALVRYIDTTGNHAPLWSPNASSPGSATPVLPAVGMFYPRLYDGMTCIHPGTITGRAVSAWDGQPASGMGFYFFWMGVEFYGGPGTHAGPDGVYRMPGLPPGQYKIQVWPENGAYFNWTFLQNERIFTLSPDSTLTVDATLTPSSTNYTGSVVSARNGRWSGAADLSFYQYKSDESTWVLNGSRTTYSDGSWWINLMRLPTRIRVQDPSGVYQPQWYDGGDVLESATILPPATTSATIRMALAKPAAIRGRLAAAEDGSGVPGITATLRYQWGVVAGTTISDADGRYSFGELDPGTYSVSFDDASRKRYSGSASGLTVAADGTRTADATLSLKPHLSGRVVDAVTGLPLAGIEVRGYSEYNMMGDTLGNPWSKAVTSADGSYTLYGLDMDYNVVVAFVDPTHAYRDQTFPGRGLPVPNSYWINQRTWTWPVNAALIPMSSLKAGRVTRVKGPNRYSTAVEASRRDFPAASIAVLASGANFADALSAATLAGAVNGPVLLTQPDRLPDGLAAELRRLGVSKVYIAGGTAAVSENVARALVAEGLPQPVRLGGRDRYGTSALIVREVRRLVPSTPDPFLCRGDSFPDALSIAPFAYMECRPILLTRPTDLPADTAAVWRELTAGGHDSAIVIGSTNAVADVVLRQMAGKSTTGVLRYARVFGKDRYLTNEAVINAYQWKWDVFGLASGEAFPDALSGGAATGYLGGPLVLTAPRALSAPAQRVLGANGPYVIMLQAFGAPIALSDASLNGAKNALGTTVYCVDGNRPMPTSLSLVAPRSDWSAPFRRAAVERLEPAFGPQRRVSSE